LPRLARQNAALRHVERGSRPFDGKDRITLVCDGEVSLISSQSSVNTSRSLGVNFTLAGTVIFLPPARIAAATPSGLSTRVRRGFLVSSSISKILCENRH
jgi:hypothetical protein